MKKICAAIAVARIVGETTLTVVALMGRWMRTGGSQPPRWLTRRLPETAP